MVRLRQGDPAAQTVFGDDPAAVARRWADQGAEWLHVVNLDGAFSGQGRDSSLPSVAQNDSGGGDSALTLASTSNVSPRFGPR